MSGSLGEAMSAMPSGTPVFARARAVGAAATGVETGATTVGVASITGGVASAAETLAEWVAGAG